MHKRRTWMGNCIALSAAFLLVCGVCCLYAVRYGSSTMVTNSVTAGVLFCAALYIGIRFFKAELNPRLIVFGAAGGVFFAACTAFGYSLHYTDTIWNNLTWGAMVCFIPFFGICTAYGLRSLSGGAREAAVPGEEKPLNENPKTSGEYLETGAEETKETSGSEPLLRRYLLTFAILFACWIPTLLASWPGIFSYDYGTQLAQWVDGAVTSHHPVLHTALLGLTRAAGLALGGTNQTGALIYSIIQMLIMSALYAYVLLFLHRRNAPGWLKVSAFVFLAFHPVNSLMALCATKDSIFGAIFSVLAVQIIEMAEDSGAFFSSVKRQAVFCVTLFFFFAFRNNAVYAFVICIPFLLVVFRKYLKRMTVLIVICLAVYFVYTGPVCGALGVEDGDVREMCSVLMQQAARVYNLDYAGLSEEEKEGILSIIDEEGLNSYISYFADPVKAYFDGDSFAENPWPFLRAWFSAGMNHKKIYVDAFLANTYGYWYPGNWIVASDDGKDYLEYECKEYREDIDVVMESKWPALSKIYDMIANQSVFMNIPVISALFSPGTYTWLLFFACLLILYTKRYGDIIVMVPAAAYFCTNLLGPVVKVRYHYPLIACAPLVLYMIWRVYKAGSERQLWTR